MSIASLSRAAILGTGLLAAVTGWGTARALGGEVGARSGVAPPVVEWLRAFGGQRPELVSAVALDPQGNVYTLGSFADVALAPGPGAPVLENAGQLDVFLTKHAPNDDLLWARRLGGPMPDGPRGLAVDARGHVYLTGYFLGTVDIGQNGQGRRELVAVGGADVLLVEYDGEGRLISARSWGGKWADSGSAVAADGAGNLYLAGTFELTVDFDPGPGQRLLTSAGRKDAFLLKLDREGRLQWAVQFGGKGRDEALGLAVDGQGNAYLVGAFEGEAGFGPDAPGPLLTVEGHSDAVLLKLSPDGEPVWARRMGGSGVERPIGVGVDRAGRVVVAGSFQGALEMEGDSATLESVGLPLRGRPRRVAPRRLAQALGGYDIFVARWRPSGELEWAQRMGGERTDLAQGLYVAPGGEALIVGYFQGSADFDPGTGEARLDPVEEGNADGFAVALDAAGRYRWAWRIGEAGVEQVSAGALGPSGEAYLAGTFSETLTRHEVAQGKIQSQGKTDVFLVKLGPPSNRDQASPTPGPVSER